MKVFSKTFLDFLKAVLISLVISFLFLFVMILIISLLNALFSFGISPNNTFSIIMTWVVLIVSTIFLFFRFSSVKDVKEYLEEIKNYKLEGFEDEYVIIDFCYYGNKRNINNIECVNFYFYNKDSFTSCLLNYKTSDNYNFVKTIEKNRKLLEEKLLVIYDIYDLKLLNGMLEKHQKKPIEGRIINLSVEYYNNSLKYANGIKNIVLEKKIEVLEENAIKRYYESFYNCNFLKTLEKSPIQYLHSYYSFLLKGGR